jgi:membrane protease YdiL (CAAX protease family)
MQHVFIIAAFSLMLMPFVLDHRLFRNTFPEAADKSASYIRQIIANSCIVAAAFAIMGFEPLFFYNGERFAGNGSVFAGTLASAAILLMTLFPVALAKHPPARAALREACRTRSFMLPVSAKENRLFAAAAFTVAVSEEVFFRSFVPQYIQDLFGFPDVYAILAAACLFALCHLLQGWSGMIQSFFGALLFSLLYISTGNLLLPVCLHFLYNIRLLYINRLLRKE